MTSYVHFDFSDRCNAVDLNQQNWQQKCMTCEDYATQGQLHTDTVCFECDSELLAKSKRKVFHCDRCRVCFCCTCCKQRGAKRSRLSVITSDNTVDNMTAAVNLGSQVDLTSQTEATTQVMDLCTQDVVVEDGELPPTAADVTKGACTPVKVEARLCYCNCFLLTFWYDKCNARLVH